MKIISKILSLSLVCFMMVCLCSCEAEDDDKDKKAGLTLWKMRGTWTTVGYSNVPSSENPIWLAQVSFWLDTDYDGGIRWYDFWSREIGNYGDVNLNVSTIEQYSFPILNIISYRENEMDVQLFATFQSRFGVQTNPELSNAILTLKKFGSALFTDDDYKFKLTNGIWIKYYSDDAFCEQYSDDVDLRKMAGMYTDFRVINFHQDGTGGFAYYSDGLGRIHDYTFDWKLENKILTIQIDGKEERQSKITLVSIEGEVGIRFGTDIFLD